MLSALSWVSAKAAKPLPPKFQPNAEEAEKHKQEMEELKEEASEQQQDAEMEDVSDNEKKASNAADAAVIKEFDLDNYDDEDENVGVFGTEMDEILQLEENNQIEEDEEDDLEDLVIKETDAIIIGVHSEDDVSHLDVYIYEESEENLYVHHDLLLPEFPLCLTWLDFHPKEEGNKGNLVAVGTFQPRIEIWDLDIIDPLEPVVTLGGFREDISSTPDVSTNGAGGKKKKKKKQALKDHLPGSHTSAVMGLSWNKFARNVIASGSADSSVKVWDISKQVCLETYDHHRDKVQSVLWHPSEATILLSGSYDKTAKVFDARVKNQVASFKLPADTENLQWNNHNPKLFMVGTEDGHVTCFDSSNTNKPLWTLAAHGKPVSGLSYNSQIPDYLATSSVDKTVKLWTIEGGQPKLVYTANVNLPVYSLGFSTEYPFLLAAGGKSDSEKIGGDPTERLIVLKTNEFEAVQTYFVNNTTKEEKK